MTNSTEPNLRSIKEEMRLAIACEWLAAGSVLNADGTYREGTVKILEAKRGSEIPHEVTAYTNRSMYEIKRLIREKYRSMGYLEDTNRADKQVNRNYIDNLLRKYDIHTEDGPKFTAYGKEFRENIDRLKAKNERDAEHQRMRNEKAKRVAVINAVLVVFLFAGLFSLIRSCASGDGRSNDEKRLDAYCASMGRSGCSETAREIRRIGNER